MSNGIAILFDGNSRNIFSAGQKVTGHVQVQTSEQIKIRGIRLEVTGNAHTGWTEGYDDDERSYSGNVNYMNKATYLIGSRSPDSEMYLEPSVYKYPFSFEIPEKLPQSFEGSYGHIRYKAKAVIDRKKKKMKDEVEIAFKVLRPLDLNQEPPQLREPLVLHKEAKASGCCCVDGFTEINVTVNRGCFVPGETLRIDGEIVNRTNSDIKYSTITLSQITVYCALNRNGKVCRTKSSTTNLAYFKRPFIQRGQTDSLNNISFVIPQGLSSTPHGNGIIHVKHALVIYATFHEIFSMSSAVCTIVIGNIPLRDDFQPSVVTAQPVGYPVPCDIAVGYIPPTNVPSLGFDNAGIEACNADGKDLPEVHSS